MASFQLVRLFVCAVLLWSTITPSTAEDTKPVGDPNPIFMAPKCVVISSYSVADSKADSEPFSPWPTTEEIVTIVREEFARAGSKLIATSQDEECGGVPSTGEDDRVLRVLLRFDFRHAQWTEDEDVVVGSAVAIFSRFGMTVVSPTTNAIFGGAPQDPELMKRARAAIFDYAHRSIVANILNIHP